MCEKKLEQEDNLEEMLKKMTPEELKKLVEELDEAINQNKDLKNIKSNKEESTKQVNDCYELLYEMQIIDPNLIKNTIKAIVN